KRSALIACVKRLSTSWPIPTVFGNGKTRLGIFGRNVRGSAIDKALEIWLRHDTHPALCSTGLMAGHRVAIHAQPARVDVSSVHLVSLLSRLGIRHSANHWTDVRLPAHLLSDGVLSNRGRNRVHDHFDICRTAFYVGGHLRSGPGCTQV